METVKLIYFDLANFKEEDIFKLSLSDEQLKIVDKIQIPQSKFQKAVSFYLKNKYVGEYRLDENDKPISDKCFFNISHSRDLVVLVIAPKPVGVDLEQIKYHKKELESYISNQKEKEFVKDDSSFFKVWTSKESLLKCLGIGIKTDLKKVPALPLDGPKEFRGKQFYSRLFLKDNYVISVTLESEKEFEIN